jgi:transposase
MISRIAKAVQSGKTRAETAAHIGVPFSTLQGWITLGRRVRRDGGAASGRELLALRLVGALESAERKRNAIDTIVSDQDLAKGVPAGKKPIGRPALLSEEILDKVTPLCVEGRLREAAAAAGVDKRSVLRWLARGREVHANGTASTEYERLCGILHARVEAAQPPVAVPELVPSADGRRGRSAMSITATAKGVEQLVAAVREGATRPQAAERIGISYRTFSRWLALGARVNEAGKYTSEHERLCGELRTGVDQADAERRQLATEPAPAVVESVELEPAPGGLVASDVTVAVGEGAPAEPVLVIGRPRRRRLLGRWVGTLFSGRQARPVPYRR